MLSWQTIAALLLVAWALGYVIWRLKQALRQPQGGSCSSCSPAKTGLQQTPIVPVDTLLSESKTKSKE